MITTDDKNTPDEREMSNMSDRDLFLVMIKDIEKRLSTVGLAFKGVNELLKRYGERLDSLEKIKQPQEQVIIKAPDNKPTRYYPNGAYMDEPEEGTEFFYVTDAYFVEMSHWDSEDENGYDFNLLTQQNCFPTDEAAEKDLRRKELTAKLYRDMRDERINGEWVADFRKAETKYYPYLNIHDNLEKSFVDYGTETAAPEPHDFYFKNETFIEDLKAMGWTEEELKIVWFNK